MNRSSLAIVFWVLGIQSGAVAQPTQEELDAKISRRLEQIERGKMDVAGRGLAELRNDLQRARLKGWSPGGTALQGMCRRLEGRCSAETGDSAAARSMKAAIIEILAGYCGDSPTASDLVLRVLESGPEALRQHALNGIGMTNAAVKGAAVYRKILDLERRGVIPKGKVALFLKYADREKALPEILGRVKAAKDEKELIAAAYGLQSFEQPRYLKELLQRARDLGLDKKRDSRGLDFYWLDGPFFQDFLGQAEGDDLKLAMEFVARGAGGDPSPVILKRNLYVHPDPVIRRASIIGLARYAGGAHGSLDDVEKLLRRRLGDEGEKTVIEEIKSQLDTIEAIRRARAIRAKHNGTKKR